MKPETEATLLELREAVWFDKVGLHDVEHVAFLGSWSQAYESFWRDQWRSIKHEAANRLTTALSTANQVRYNQWNEILRNVRPVAANVVSEKIAAANLSHYPNEFPLAVELDIALLLMEAEYSDVCPPKFFAALGFYYVRGHFPCGWEGEYPKGRLVVY